MSNYSRVLTREQERWAYEKWCNRYTYLEIATALGVCEKTVVRALKGKPRIKPILEYDGSDSVEYGRPRKTGGGS